jgi:S-formylglutathione hydrolase FrmB
VSLSLLHGTVPWVLSLLGLSALGWLLLAPGARSWSRRLPQAVAAAALATCTLVLLTDRVWQPFPDALPADVVWLLGSALLALATAAFRFNLVAGWRRRTLVPVSVVVVVLSCLSGVNLSFGAYPTIRSLFADQLERQVSLDQVNGPADLVSGRPLAAAWHRPDGLADHGAVTTAEIPGAVSGFHGRPALIYLPPAYLTAPRARLPVLVLLTGQPGAPRDWFTGGQLAARMDRFAAIHDGLAPVVVVPDMLGSQLSNPLCLDSQLGNVASYVDVDVPAWIRATLHVDPDPARWAVGGFSSGGTCALQAAVRSPGVYPTLLDISGQDEATLGSRSRTAREAFGGDEAALSAVEPMTELASRSLPGSAAMVVAGDHDNVYRPQQRRVADALGQAGVDVQLVTLHGGHSWSVWGPAIDRALPWLADRMALT